jgi:phosphoribosylformylglycinamidine synthase
VALAESCIAGSLGADIELAGHAAKLEPAQLLFSESAGRFVVSVKKRNERAFKAAMRGVKSAFIGAVSKAGALQIKLKGQLLVNAPIISLEASWKKTMGW